MVSSTHIHYAYIICSHTDNDTRLQALWQVAQQLPKANKHNLRSDSLYMYKLMWSYSMAGT